MAFPDKDEDRTIALAGAVGSPGIEFLDFVHGRLRQEEPLVAACQLDQ